MSRLIFAVASEFFDRVFMTYLTAGDHSVILEESAWGVVDRLLGSWIGGANEEPLG